MLLTIFDLLLLLLALFANGNMDIEDNDENQAKETSGHKEVGSREDSYSGPADSFKCGKCEYDVRDRASLDGHVSPPVEEAIGGLGHQVDTLGEHCQEGEGCSHLEVAITSFPNIHSYI